eukprot:m.14714 g.14714  ORF g.14714 m.14714 type:complete len:111 (+) comp10332_c0_seq3:121-453(+)
MIFCPTCGNMLVLSTAMDVGYYFICQSCPYKHEIENGKVRARRVMHNEDESDVVYGGDAAKEMMDMTETDCPKCHHNRASYFQMQTRSADEPMTVFYCCESCNHKWNDGS